MWFLYCGFLLGQSYSVISVMHRGQVPFSAIIFSLIVFLIWSWAPLLGYVAARISLRKAFDIELQPGRLTLFATGLGVSLLDYAIYYFHLLHARDGYLPILIPMLMFFCVTIIMPPFSATQAQPKRNVPVKPGC